MLCLTLTGKNSTTCIEQYHTHKDCVELVELRVDMMDDPTADEISRILHEIPVPKILTCRRAQDGGSYRGSERSRVQLMMSLIDLGFAYIDLEEDCKNHNLENRAKELSLKIIRSYHDLSGIPIDLFAKIVKLRKRGDIAKIAVTPKSIDDVIMLFKAKRELQSIEEKIVIGMGDWGIPTRILYKLTGSIFTFCSPEGTAAASGHLSPEMMHNLYHSDRVNDDTKIFGIIGNPVMHTSSPKIHNPAFEKIGLNAVYVPFLVDNVRSFFHLAEMLPIQGFSVTVPHKQNVLPYLGKISREVKLIGSCNTVLRNKRLWKGMNTDFYGFLKPIEQELDSQQINTAAVIGAGGAARSVVWALRNYHCKVTILNRTEERAKRLAMETGSDWGSLADIDKIEKSDLIVQTTSAGMEPYEDIDPIERYQFTGNEIVYDLVYKPKETKMMKRAKAKGCRLVYGMEMLMAQGVLQFESFTGFSYPDDIVVT